MSQLYLFSRSKVALRPWRRQGADKVHAALCPGGERLVRARDVDVEAVRVTELWLQWLAVSTTRDPGSCLTCAHREVHNSQLAEFITHYTGESTIKNNYNCVLFNPRKYVAANLNVGH